ncbi:MAG: T9SS type A sorting domain-containing protein [Chitinophagaceae bacterium]|nr:T9SS type A sorting domain-containing protein [Chitinophagaceae bacterium]
MNILSILIRFNDTSTMKHWLLLFFTVLNFGRPHFIAAQAGNLDFTFGTNGKVITTLSNFGQKGNAMAIQSDGKILCGGLVQYSFTSSEFALAKYHQDGSLDSSFGINGYVHTAIEAASKANAIALQSDGKILLGGDSQWYVNLARYLINGTPDTTFGVGGKIITDIIGYYSEKCKSLEIQNDGKILVGGYAMHNANDNPYFILARYHSNGTPDSTFGNNSQVIGVEGYGNSMALQSDGKILLAGSSNDHFAVARYLSNGVPDSSFGTNGVVITILGNAGMANAMKLQNDGKIVLGGYVYNAANTSDFGMVRYLTNGSIDTVFGSNGVAITTIGSSDSRAYSIGLQSDGKIILAGYRKNTLNLDDLAVAKYHTDGSLDLNFGLGGTVITPIGNSYCHNTSMGIQSDDKIVLCGYAYDGSKTDIALVRYYGHEAVGVEEPIATNQEVLVYPNPAQSFLNIDFLSQPMDLTLKIYHMNGQLVKEINHLSERHIQLSQHGLAPGIYSIQGIEHHRTIYAQRIVIE